MGCLNSFHTDNVLKKHKRLCDNNDYCYIEMLEEGKNLLRYLPGEKSLKAPFTIYFDFECLLIKEQSCQNNLEKSYTERKAKHEPSGYSLSLICSFDVAKNRHYLYRGKDCTENFCKKLKELGTEIINSEEKEMILLTDEEIKSYKEQKVRRICKGKFCYHKNKGIEFKRNHKVRDHCHYTRKVRGAHNTCNLRCKVPKKIPVLSHNGSAYDWHFIIRQLAEDFKGQFECLGENAEKYISFLYQLLKKLLMMMTVKKKKKMMMVKKKDDDGTKKKKNRIQTKIY